MSPGFSEAKALLRRQLQEKLKRLGPEERAVASREIRRRLIEQPIWQAAQSLLLYAPTADEPDIWPLVDDALAQGRQVMLPRYLPAAGLYVACRLRQPARDLAPGQFGILEPTAECPRFDVKRLDLAVVPGIGFSRNGGRLGRGKGYYDRLLTEVAGFKCGVGFDCQVAAEFPLEPHDVRLNCILTPACWHWVVGQPGS